MSVVERFEREVVFTVKRAMIEVSADTATFLEGIAGVEGKSVATVVEELAYARWQETRLIEVARGLAAWGEAIGNVGDLAQNEAPEGLRRRQDPGRVGSGRPAPETSGTGSVDSR